MNGEQIRQCLHDGQSIYGTHIAIGSSYTAFSMILAMAQMDFAFFCAEHQPLDRAETSALCRMSANCGISPIVRIPYPSATEAAKALDAGAQGIVAPYVETVEQVREMAGAVHYRPVKGKMLREFLSGERKPDPKTTEFFKRFNRHNYLIIGVESVAAYDNLESLISIDGVDGVFIGPHDMSVSLEIPEEWGNAKFHDVIDDIVARCRAAKVGVGVHMPPGIFSVERVKRLLSLGMNWILDGSDAAWAVHSLNERRRAMGLKPALSAGTETAEISSCMLTDQNREN